MNKYTDYEKEILESFENDEWQSAPNLESEKKKYSRIARDTILKNKRINIRISERDLSKLKSKSVEEGIPYQTLAVSYTHLRAHETVLDLVCRLLLEKKKKNDSYNITHLFQLAITVRPIQPSNSSTSLITASTS